MKIFRLAGRGSGPPGPPPCIRPCSPKALKGDACCTIVVHIWYDNATCKEIQDCIKIIHARSLIPKLVCRIVLLYMLGAFKIQETIFPLSFQDLKKRSKKEKVTDHHSCTFLGYGILCQELLKLARREHITSTYHGLRSDIQT